ncbi:type VII toxin-antitoxin system MntA family adenylyltransferase antitoxin [Halorubrum ezzemoulense]|uniref:type VII toxin-antitoxin system MntA family adenylyltransferase antitoxin n=1 Tax=Halorubrum ezzemoulense TaxID=337243 RepID=UPI00232F9BB3|nr:nucleotidyltransferase domain-containing protein [Halorubrum ezzemoulense]MDB9235543.1 nucleotidyltransferase domain-containing protein [Halorubrum ezzemoulense]
MDKFRIVGFILRLKPQVFSLILYNLGMYHEAMRTVESTTLESHFDIETVQAILREHPIRLAILFGSHATETTHEASDIDIAVEFDGHEPAERGYNEAFLGLSADLSDELNTDDIDLVDLHTVTQPLATAIFETGILLIGNSNHAAELRHELTASGTGQQTPRERLETTRDSDYDFG